MGERLQHEQHTGAGIAQLVGEESARLWSVFFLVVTGRAQLADDLTAEEYEQVFEFLYRTAAAAPFDIKTTEAPHYRRVVATRDRAASCDRQAEAARLGPRQLRATRAVNDGNGFVFVDHVGNICPSGFLPMPRGNVRENRLVSVYRDDALFRRLRDPGALEDHCGRCEWRAECGGSRSRAFAATGNPFAGDPLCAYRPA